jgi:hypothetical protein
MNIRRLPPVDAGADSDSAATNGASSVLTANGSDDSGADLYLGYDGGFVVSAKQEAASLEYFMRINSWSHSRHTLFDSNGPNPDLNTFSLERLRLSFSGHAFSPDLKYFIQLDGTSDRSTQTRMLDYFITYDLLPGNSTRDENLWGIQFGKWKVPFNRSREESGRRLLFTERATANVFFDLNRSIGIGTYGRCFSHVQPVRWEAALFNGYKTGMSSTNRGDDELDRNPGCSFRSYTDLWGDYGDDGEPDLIWRKCPVLRLGGGAAYTRVDREGTNEFRRQRVVDSGEPLADVLPAGVEAYDVWFYTVDSHLKYRGLSIIAEYYWRTINQFRGEVVPGLSDDGFLLQAGYFVIPQTLDLHVRWARIRGDSGTLGLTDQSLDEIGAGFTWFVRGHNAKLVFDAAHVNGAPLSSSRLDILPGDAGWLYRTQIQLAL